MADRPTQKIGNDNPTRLVGDVVAAPGDSTRAVRSTDKPRAQASTRFALGALAEGTMLFGDYKVVQTFRAHETGRPGVYLCDTASERVVVKVYPLDFPPSADVWAQIGQLNHPHVVRIVRQVLQDGLYCDVLQYCECGSLVEVYLNNETKMLKVPMGSMLDRFAPQMLDALKYVHSMGLVHRDIKPSNILIEENAENPEFLLGDFDISSKLSLQLDQRITMRAAGTWTYTAPEAFPRYQDEEGVVGAKVTRASDYYSLGVTMLEMACGTTPLHTCKLPDMFDFYLSGQKIDVPLSIPERLRLLIQGLLIRNSSQRWGEAQVGRWLTGTNTDVDVQLITDDREHSPFSKAAGDAYSFGAQHARSFSQLAEMFAADPEMAADHLRMSDALYQWVGQRDTSLAILLRKDVQKYINHPDLAMIGACRLDPNAPMIFFNGLPVRTAEQWLSEAERIYPQRKEPDCWLDEKEAERLLLWLQRRGAADRDIARRLEGLEVRNPECRLAEVSFVIDPRRGISLAEGVTVSHPVDFSTMAYGDEQSWTNGIPACYEQAYRVWSTGILEAWFRQRGLTALAVRCADLKETMRDTPYGAFETILRVINPKLPTVKVSFERIPPVTLVYGKPTRVALNYHTIGPGCPLMRFVGMGDKDEAYLETPVIGSREGQVWVKLTGMVTLKGVPRLMDIKSTGPFSKLVGGEPTLTYEVVTNSRMFGVYVGWSAAYGLLGLWLPRQLMQYTGINELDFELRRIAAAIGMVVLAVMIFLGRMMYLSALKSAEEE